MIRQLAWVLVITLWSASAMADWQLDSEASVLTFVSTKASTVAEVLTFRVLQGRVTESGNAELSIDLTSVDTAIELRDERMQAMLFETESFPVARLSMTIDTSILDAQTPGSSMTLENSGELSLHGVESELTATLRVLRLSDDRLVVVSEKPVIVNASAVNLVDGLEALREIAGLPSISQSVPVSFILYFNRV